ncbi:MAG TPA: magnesium and cobalt transport protein CorA [Candidatus Nanopelagicaceae bacterium]
MNNSNVIVDFALYENGHRVEGNLPLAQLIARTRQDGGFVWLGMAEPTHDEFDQIANEFDFHPLAVEDAVSAKQRPKIEDYAGLTFFVMRTVFYNEALSEVTTGEILCFLGDHFIVIVRHGEGTPLARVRHELEFRPEILAQGPFAVLHAVVDRVIDAYTEIAGELEIDVIEIENKVFSGKRQTVSEEIYFLKRELIEYRHAIEPLVVPLQILSAKTSNMVAEDLKPFFRDAADHLMRACEYASGLDSLLGAALQADLAHAQVQQNEDMRRIAAWVALGVAPTMVAGIYGMNFTHMPELQWRYGYPMVVGGLILLTGFLVLKFIKSDWL